MPLTITLDDKEFTLSNEALVAMASAFWHTKVKERGMMLCQDTEITPGDEHVGGRGSITERNCWPPGEKGPRAMVGSYHTHPTIGAYVGTSQPSWGDAYAILSQSYWHDKPWLGCRGGKYDEEIRCDTVKEIPSLATLRTLKHKRKRMFHAVAEDDPEIWRHFAKPYSFPVRKVPEIIKPPAPPPAAPRIKSEELVFAGSAFTKYTNLDTGEIRIERIY